MAVLYLVVHGVLFAEILAVLCQHLGEHYVALIPGEREEKNCKLKISCDSPFKKVFNLKTLSKAFPTTKKPSMVLDTCRSSTKSRGVSS
jgi:hypothetical protein